LKLIFKKISLASDHAGFTLKETIKKKLIKNKVKVLDFGPYNKDKVDYPDYAKKVARNISSKKTNMGILVCGSGTGMAMSANKLRKIRAAVCYNSVSTRLSRTHNNANILALGSRLTNKREALKLVNIFLSTKFEGGRHLRRIKKI
jgi:ribose 5-phosphate isomerase B|tara:strand:- start:126 stop:563 length:438 start_codon:yes stop_codon:yes gene_type:complete